MTESKFVLLLFRTVTGVSGVSTRELKKKNRKMKSEWWPVAELLLVVRFFGGPLHAFAALRIPIVQQNKSPTAFAMRLFVLASPGGFEPPSPP